MSYLVLARKYRPQTLEQVISQDHVTQTLKNAITANRVAHAILFTGPRGTGKTTIARIIAKAMNCIKGPTPLPCNACQACQEITKGQAADVYEIDGASNNSVDQIRDILTNIKYKPALTPFKIYIIDEVHMLSTAAFNALLKTLEEPPSHVMFLFATTEPHKIPITILSRCQRHDLKRVQINALVTHMSFLCKHENISLTPESLTMIAKEADGSVRDALSLLDQVMSCADDQVPHEKLLTILGMLDRQILFDIATAILTRNLVSILTILDDIYRRGLDMVRFYLDLVEHFRNLIIIKMSQHINQLVDVSNHELTLMTEQVQNTSLFQLNQIFDILFTEEAVIRQASNPKLAIEMLFVKLHQIPPTVAFDDLIEKIDQLYKKFAAAAPPVLSSPPPNEPPHQAFTPPGTPPRMPQKTVSGASDENPSAGSDPNRPSEDAHPSSQSTASFHPLDGDLNETWRAFKTHIEKHHPSIAACLSKSTLKSLTNQSMAISIVSNRFDVDRIKKNKDKIGKCCLDFFGIQLNITITENIIAAPPKQNPSPAKSTYWREAVQDQVVTETLKVFGGEIVDVKSLGSEKK